MFYVLGKCPWTKITLLVVFNIFSFGSEYLSEHSFEWGQMLKEANVQWKRQLSRFYNQDVVSLF